MDSQVVTINQFASVMALIQEAIADLYQIIDGQHAQQVSPQDGTHQTEVAPPPVTASTSISEDPHERMDRLEQRLRHLMGFRHTDFGSLVQALYSIKEDIVRGLCSESSPTDSKGTRPLGRQRPEYVGAISLAGLRPPRRYQKIKQTSGFHYPPPPRHRETFNFLSYSSTAMLRNTVYKTVFIVGYVVEPGSLETHRDWGLGHETDLCIALRHTIQDLIDQGMVHLGQLSLTTNPLPTHTTHVVPLLADGIHSMDFTKLDDRIHMLSWDDYESEPIVVDESYEVDGVISDSQASAPFRLDVQYVIRGGRVVRQQPPTFSRPVESNATREETRQEDDEILRQL
ncbi:hypothetical protein CK203_035491 [Vitis vinifera]|uniref:Uncharacterized protein n=1 Tax=Vitis vinifera TaxID=29760 RepID=A0A438I3J6_VITVI|nr:hypothetical protein CK203_035491 [Vitis vinifera]